LIRSRDGQGSCRPFAARHTHPPRAIRAQPWSEVIQFPAPQPGKAMGHWLVYLTWNKTAFGHAILRPQVTPTLGGTSGSDVSLSSQLSNLVRLDGSASEDAQQSNR
jgi:hypothetical protein